MKILIIEDEFLIADLIGIILRRNGFSNIEHANTIEQATLAIQQDEPEVCLVDIRLNNENGIDFARILQQRQIPFVFITANNEMETIRVAALTNPQAYLSKPINEKDLIATLEIIRAKFPNHLVVKTAKGKVRIRQSDILFIQADNVYSKIICESRTYLERITLKELQEQLDSYLIRVHRSFIVNKNRIEAYKSNEVSIGSHKIPVAKQYQEVVIKN